MVEQDDEAVRANVGNEAITVRSAHLIIRLKQRLLRRRRVSLCCRHDVKMC